MSATLIVTLINIFFFLIIALGILIGIKRGIEFSALHFSFILVALVISIFIANPITRACLSIKIDGQRLETILLDLLGGLASVSPTLSGATTSLVAAVVVPVVFIVVACLMCAIFEIIYQLITRLWIRKKNLIPVRKPLKFYGSIFGVLEMFVFTTLLFMPITSLSRSFIELAESEVEPSITIVQNGSTASISDMIHTYVPEKAIDVIKIYNESPMGKIVSMGGFDTKIYNSMARIEKDGKTATLDGDILPFAKLVDKLLVEVDYYYNHYEYASIEPVKRAVEDVLNSPLEGFLKRVMREIIARKDTLTESLNLEYEFDKPVSDVVDLFAQKLQDKNFSLGEYLTDNFNHVLDSVDSLAKSGGLKAILDVVKGASAKSLIDDKIIASFESAVPTLLDAPLITDAYPIFATAMQINLPSALGAYIDVDELENHDVFDSELQKIFQILGDLVKVKVGDENLASGLILGKLNFTNELINSDSAEQIFSKVASTKLLKNITIDVFSKIDNEVRTLIKSLNSDIIIRNNHFNETISQFSPDEFKYDFILRASAQSADVIEVARYAYNNLTRETLPEFVNLLKTKVAKYYDEATKTSSSVLSVVFDNLVRYFNGTILDNMGSPAFADYETFNSKVLELTSDIENLTSENMYYFVDFEQILENLI